MKGREVSKIAVRATAQAAREILEQRRHTADQITWIHPHQAGRRIVATLAWDLARSSHRSVINLDRHGNTSAASIPLALHKAWRAGRVKPGALVPLPAFGAGLTCGSALIRW